MDAIKKLELLNEWIERRENCMDDCNFIIKLEKAFGINHSNIWVLSQSTIALMWNRKMLEAYLKMSETDKYETKRFWKDIFGGIN